MLILDDNDCLEPSSTYFPRLVQQFNLFFWVKAVDILSLFQNVKLICNDIIHQLLKHNLIHTQCTQALMEAITPYNSARENSHHGEEETLHA